MASELPRLGLLDTASKFALFSVFGLKDEKLIKKQTYMKAETCKLYSRIFWIFLPNFIKIDHYNFELYCFKVGAFLRHSVQYKNVLTFNWYLKNRTKDVMTLNSLARHSSRLDQRHWTHVCRRLTVCSVVRPSSWQWRTEDGHDDLLTQWQAYTVQSGTCTLKACRADTDYTVAATRTVDLTIYIQWSLYFTV